MENKVRQRRKELGMSQLDLATAAHCSREYINKLEMGKVPSPGIKICKRISRALAEPVESLWA